MAGELPNRAVKLIQQWAELHKNELKEDWDRAVSDQELLQIKPLK